MATNLSADGNTITITAAGNVTKGAIYPLTECAGVALNTVVTGESLVVALEGVFDVTKKAGALLDFAAGEYVQTLTTGGVEKAVATGGSEVLGIAMEAAATGATTVLVKLCRW